MSEQPAEEATPPAPEEKVEGDATKTEPAESPATEQPPSESPPKPEEVQQEPTEETAPVEQEGEPKEEKPAEAPLTEKSVEEHEHTQLMTESAGEEGKALEDKSEGAHEPETTESKSEVCGDSMLQTVPGQSGVSLDTDSLAKVLSSGYIGQSFSRTQDLSAVTSVTKREKLSSRAKLVLGSVIDIKSQLTGDGADRRAARYANTYKLDSNNPFNPEKVDKILREVMTEALENLAYDPDKCPSQAKWASNTIRTKVKQLDFDRYKFVCIVTIGEKNSQDVYATCRFLWDVDRDRYATFALENTHVFGIAYCFGLYYE